MEVDDNNASLKLCGNGYVQRKAVWQGVHGN